MVEPTVKMSRQANDGKQTQKDVSVSCGLRSAGLALLPGLGCNSGTHSDLHSGQFSQRKKAQAYYHLRLLSALLMDSVIHHFSRSKDNNHLCISSSASLHNTQTSRLLFLFQLFVTYLVTSHFPLPTGRPQHSLWCCFSGLWAVL